MQYHNCGSKQKKVSIFKIILCFLFFPVAITVIVFKNNKLRPFTKFAIIAVFWIFLFWIGTFNFDETTVNDNTFESKQTEQVNDVTSTSYSEETVSNVVKYHNNKQINSLLTSYNLIAEHTISPEMVENGAYGFSANIYCNGVWIMVHTTDNSGVFVDYYDESVDDEKIYPVFRDFCKALNCEIIDEDVRIAWNALQSEKYQNYNYYVFNGIEATYSKKIVTNGDYNYIIKTNFKE